MMKSLFILAALSTASYQVTASVSESKKASIVVDLSEVNLTTWLKRQPVALVFFFVPGNPDNQRLLYAYNAFASGFQRTEKDVAFAKIDCTAAASKETCLPYVDAGFPAVTIFRDGQPWSRELNPASYRIHEEDLRMERTWNREAAKNNDPNFDADADYSTLTKAMSDLIALQKEKEEESKYPVVDITGVDFSAWLKRNPVALVMFYTPQSVNYGTLLKIYSAFADSLKTSNAKVTAVKIDCSADTSKNACIPYFDSVFPTFTVFRNGQPWTGEESPDASRRIREEDLYVEGEYERMTANMDISYAERGTINAPYMASLRKAMAKINVIRKEQADEEAESEEELYFEDVVVYLNGDDFSARLKAHPVALVMFYSPMSLYYQKVTSFFDTFCKVIHQTYPDTLFAKVDCSMDESEEICDDYTDEDLISFAVFKNGVIYQNAYKNIPEGRLKETWYLDGLNTVVDKEFPDLQDAEIADPLKKALASLVGVHLEMVVGKPRKTRREEF